MNLIFLFFFVSFHLKLIFNNISFEIYHKFYTFSNFFRRFNKLSKEIKTDKVDANVFSKVLRETKLKNNILHFGNFSLQGIQGTADIIQYNNRDFELLKHMHEYTFPLLDGDLQVSLQLYLNENYHFRLFCYTKAHSKAGMTFSLNLTTEKETHNIIFLTQKIKFSERYDGDENLVKAHRRRKQIVFIDLLNRLGIEITDNNDVILGVFNPKNGNFENTNKEKFLNDFIMISILKGHFQGNKGYQLEILPNYNQLDYIFEKYDSQSNTIPQKILKKRGKRIIPLAMRYKVLRNDNNKCVACGRSAKDGVQLHIDHKVPFSLGGMTELKNLQTLCSECNISKSNKFID